jgi:crotonobetainyl-CoA:carnitine CoA-transferase CaiB-like acyl-CoA transferase
MTGVEMALSDLVVLDLTIARAGPVAVRHFADWGANVIRIDSPNGNDLIDPLDRGLYKPAPQQALASAGS